MKRRNFFKALGIATTAVVVAPMTAITPYVHKAEVYHRPIKEELLEHLFQDIQAEPIHGSFYVRLYDDDGKETDYQGYEKGGIEMPRNNEHWHVEGNEDYVRATNIKDVTFPECIGGQNHVGGFAITDESGRVIFTGPLTNWLTVERGVTPEFLKGSITIDED